jgi:PAS domain S-box-containing protein
LPEPQREIAESPLPAESVGAVAPSLPPRATPRRRRSLQHDLLPPLVAFGGLVAAVGTWRTTSSLEAQLREQAHRRIEDFTQAAGRAAETVSHPRELQPLLTALHVEENVQWILVVAGEPPAVIASTRSDWSGQPLSQLPGEYAAGILKTIANGTGRQQRDVELETILFTAPFSPPAASGGSPGARGAVAVLVDSRPLEAQLSDATARTILWQVAGVALTTLVAFLLLKHRVLRPLSAIQKAMDRRTQGQAGGRAPALGSGELGSLAETLNRMLDVTETQRERITTLVANVPGAVYRCTTSDPPAMLFMSPAIQGITGYAASEFVGSGARSYASLIHPADLDEVRRGQREGVDGLKAFALEYRIQHKSGELRWVSERGRAVAGRDGRILSLDGVIWDVTERKSAEEQLGRYVLQLEQSKERIEQQAGMLSLQARELAVARDRALEGARAKSEFLAMMSHEIRTPMNGVIGMTELLLAGGLKAEERQLAEMIQSSGEALLAILNDVLDFSKIEAGRLELEAIEFELASVVEDAVELFGERACSKGLELVLRLDQSLPARVCGDPGRVRQVLLNLIGNAVKFTERGRVVVSVQPYESLDGGTRIAFRVIDTGIGIPRKLQRRLFHSFSQADASTTRRFGGTGLGLAISRRLVELMGGSIEVESEPERGSTFWFVLRFEQSAGRVERDVRLEGVRALVALPDPEAQAALVDLLGAEGLLARGVEASASLGAALAEARREERTPAVLLLDSARFADARSQASLPSDAPPIVLLAPLGARVERDAWPASRVRALVTRPTRRRHLRRALFEALGLELEPGPAVPQRSASAKKSSAPMRAARVLVVEDNAVNRKLTTALLERFGHHSDVASNGREAVEAVAATRYDLVIMDCQMPEMDGFEATRRIREVERAGTRTPILAMTANAMDGDRERCIAAGMDDYVTKPIRPAKLEEAVARLLGRALTGSSEG